MIICSIVEINIDNNIKVEMIIHQTIIYYFKHNILQHPVTHNFVSNIFAFVGP